MSGTHDREVARYWAGLPLLARFSEAGTELSSMEVGALLGTRSVKGISAALSGTRDTLSAAGIPMDETTIRRTVRGRSVWTGGPRIRQAMHVLEQERYRWTGGDGREHPVPDGYGENGIWVRGEYDYAEPRVPGAIGTGLWSTMIAWVGEATWVERRIPFVDGRSQVAQVRAENSWSFSGDAIERWQDIEPESCFRYVSWIGARGLDGPGPPLEMEMIDRERRLVERRIRQARFPVVKQLESFDFKAIPGLNKMLVLDLARGDYIDRRENVILLGPSGVRKTHVALALGLAACQKGLSVRFATASHLVHEMIEARDEKRLLRLQAQLARASLLIVDELGYVPLSQSGSELLFDVFSRRYENGATLVTSNLPFQEWTTVFASERLTGALLDRITHHVHILEMNGESYRLKQSRSRRRQPSE